MAVRAGNTRASDDGTCNALTFSTSAVHAYVVCRLARVVHPRVPCSHLATLPLPQSPRMPPRALRFLLVVLVAERRPRRKGISYFLCN